MGLIVASIDGLGSDMTRLSAVTRLRNGENWMYALSMQSLRSLKLDCSFRLKVKVGIACLDS